MTASQKLRIPGGLLVILFVAATAVPVSTVPAHAQDSVHIAAVVNDQPVTMLEVHDRMALILATTGIADTPENRERLLSQVLRMLVDERLQVQEGERAGLGDMRVDNDQAYWIVEQNLGLPDGQLAPFLENSGVNPETLDAQLRAEMIWSTLVRRRMRIDRISTEDIEREFDRRQVADGQPAWLLAEIFLAVDDPATEQDVETSMIRLREAVRSGADFSALARQFSQGASAREGGDLGWIAENQFSDELAAVIPDLDVGEVSPPIRVIGGYAVILVRDRRTETGTRLGDVRITMRQAVFPLGAGDDENDAQQRAAAAAGAIGACDDLDTLGGTEPGPVVGTPITVGLNDLQPLFRDALLPLEAGQASAPVRTDQGYHVMVVCEREEGGELTHDDIRRLLEAEQFDLISRGYLRDLRRTSFVDIRL